MKKTPKAAATQPAAKAPAVAAPTPAKKVAAKKAAVKKPATKAAAPKPAPAGAASSKTTIVAHIDVGLGNTLFLRGDAPGLSWSTGIPMECESDNTWSIAISGVTAPFEFKVLRNDSDWSAGPNSSAQPGETVDIEPSF